MNPIKTRNFKMIVFVGIILAGACVAVAVTDNSHMKYTDETLMNYTPHQYDELVYQVNVDGSDYYLELIIEKVAGDLECRWEQKDTDDHMKADGTAWLNYAFITGDLEVLTKNLEESHHSKMCKHTTDYGTLSCREYRYSGDDVEYTDLLSITDTNLRPDGTNVHTGDVSLEFWIYDGHLFDYNLEITESDGTVHSLSINVYNIEPAA